MIDLVYHKGAYRQPKPNHLGFPPAAIPAVVAGVSKLISVLKSTGKSGRDQFFDARIQVSQDLFRAYQAELGYNYDAMYNYFWPGHGSGVATANERVVVDRWWAELNAQRIGNDAASASNLSVQTISFKKFDFAFDALDAAFKSYVSKYMSGNPAAALPSKAQEQIMQQQVAQASMPSGSLLAKFNNLPAEGKTVVMGTAAVGALLILTAVLKATKVV